MSARAGGAFGGGGGGGPCGACKFLRRKCVSGCIFAPYFGAEQGSANFSAVHKIFGASNVSKLLLLIPAAKRLDAVLTICYEAQARLRDPVHGCVSHIFALQQQVVSLQAEIAFLRARLASLEQAAPPSSSSLTVPMSGALTGSTLAPPFDLATLFEAPVNPPPARPGGRSDGGDDLRLLARELAGGQKSAAN